MQGFTTVVWVLAYFFFLISIGIYVLVLLTRFVKAHQRGAEALESIAKKLGGEK